MRRQKDASIGCRTYAFRLLRKERSQEGRVGG